MEEEKYKELLNILSNINENELDEYEQIKLLFKRFIFLGNEIIEKNNIWFERDEIKKDSEYYNVIKLMIDRFLNNCVNKEAFHVEVLSKEINNMNPFSYSEIYECANRASSLSSSDTLRLTSSKEGTILKMNGKHNVFDLFANYIAIRLTPRYDMDSTIKVIVEGSSTKDIVNNTFKYILYGIVAFIDLCVVIIVISILCHCYCEANSKPKPAPQNMTPLQPQAAQPPQYYPPQQIAPGKLYP